MTKSELLLIRAARAALAEPAHWTQETLARNALGEPTSPISSSAVCWCVEGALRAAEVKLPGLDHGAFQRALSRLGDMPRVREFFCTGIVSWQDEPHRTHAEVLLVLDEGIAALEREAP